MEIDERLTEQLEHLPSTPGVYIYRDSDGSHLYVGKAKNLRKRVKQYFTGKQNSRTAVMVSNIDSVEVIVAGSEKEALLMEANLIKTYRPHYNIDLKDDKSYPYFRITTGEEFPRLEITRRIFKDKSTYFGPFTDVGSARRMMGYLHRAFPLRRCKGARPGGRTTPGRPCLDFQMGRCTGPCAGEISAEEYGKMVDGVMGFLKGQGRRIAASWEKEMARLSSSLRFEEAAVLRDRVMALHSILEGQNAVGDPGDDLDILGYVACGPLSVLICLFVRSGLIVGRKEMALDGQYSAEEAMDAFISAHYRKDVAVPGRILFPVGLEFAPEHAEILSELAGRSVRIQRPSRGKGARLLHLAEENARQAFDVFMARRETASHVSSEIAAALGMESSPKHIECMDISHTSGRLAYGSIVSWKGGELDKEGYRLFSIRDGGVPGDDYAALEEVITRRFTGTAAGELKTPDLLLIDGGKGQLSRVSGVMAALNVEVPFLAAISKARAAKRRDGANAVDEIYLPGRSNPKRLPRNSRALHTLQMLRDEAHRFALKGHRAGRGKADLLSILDGIEGVGPARRKALLTHYRSLSEIKAARLEDIASLKGLNMRVAERIKETLEKDTLKGGL